MQAGLYNPPKAVIDTNVLKLGIKTEAELAPLPQRQQAEAHAVRRLVQLAGHGKLIFANEMEIILEVLHTTNLSESRRIHDLLGDVYFDSIPSPFEYPRIITGWIPGFGPDTKEFATARREAMLDFAIANYQRMREIHETLGMNKKADAYHIWTAECACIDFFVTLDRKLVNSALYQKKVKFKTQIVYPTEVVNQLGCWSTNSSEHSP